MTTHSQTPIVVDPIVAEVRKARDEMAREANYDLHTLCERLRAEEREHPERLVATPAQRRAQEGER
ncbi:MAG TPA: hypothetical protein PKI11_10910 [Candidatus Hydrogenedentes bacterium]|nr:hypothetical protein [Candidatus Hydrogenedentota bacterium]HNT86878.1 hypothetical protein [Candidatus Hydrogenedentota bacterium]